MTTLSWRFLVRTHSTVFTSNFHILLTRTREGMGRRVQKEALLSLRKYETFYLLRSDLSEDVQKRINNKIFETISNDEGKLLQVESWGNRKTAYPVLKQNKALFFLITYAGQPGVVAKLTRLFRITEEVVKYQSLKVADEVTAEELEQDVVFTEKARDENDGRGRQGRGRGRDRGDRGDRGDRRDRRDRDDRGPSEGRAKSEPTDESTEAATEG